MAELRAVTFDFWNTLVRPEQGALAHRLAAWQRLLDEAGHAVEPEVLAGVFEAQWNAHQDAWHRNEQFTSVHGTAGALQALGIDPAEVPVDALRAAFGGTEGGRYDLCPGVGDALDAIHAAGVRLGIICDVGFTPSPVLRAMLERHGVLGYFDAWSFSDEVGWYKPAAQIFAHAMASLGVHAHESAHVGDLRRTDVAGALATGMTAVRYHGVHDDPDVTGPDAHHDLADHRLLAAILQIG